MRGALHNIFFNTRIYLAILLCAMSLPTSKLEAVAETSPAVKKATPLFGTRLKPVQVRIPITLTRYRTNSFQPREGGPTELRAIAVGDVSHTLRARLDQRNHFHIDDLHIETIPQRWHAESRSYAVKINIYRTFGHQGSLEEFVGSLDVAGQLEGRNRIFNLIAHALGEFNDPQGYRYLTVVAGEKSSQRPPQISRQQPQGNNKQTPQVR